MDMLPLVGGEVRVVAGSGSRLPKASKSILLLSDAMAAFFVVNQAEPKLLVEAMCVDCCLPHDFLTVWKCCCCGANTVTGRC